VHFFGAFCECFGGDCGLVGGNCVQALFLDVSKRFYARQKVISHGNELGCR
jgi:hypothetical protein